MSLAICYVLKQGTTAFPFPSYSMPVNVSVALNSRSVLAVVNTSERDNIRTVASFKIKKK